MNYIRELNAFRDWLMLNQLNTSGVALWYTLMSVNNMAGWTEWFTVPNSTLQQLAKLSKQGLADARNELKIKGLIDYKPGSKKQAGQYKMISLVKRLVNSVDQTVDQSLDLSLDQTLDQTVDQSADQHLTINKHKQEIKQNKTSTTNPFHVFESEGFGTISSFIADELGDLVDTYSAGWVIEAMKEAARCGKRNLKYAHAILKRWRAEGIDQPWQSEKNVQTAPVPSGGVARAAPRPDKYLEARRREIALNRWIDAGGDPDEFVYQPTGSH